MTKAFVYCGVSTEEQSEDDHYGVALQEKRGRAFAKQKGWRVAKVREDVGSGKDDQRPGYHELRKDIAAGEADVAIADRLSRNVRAVYDFLERTRQGGVGFVSTSKSFDTTTAMGRASDWSSPIGPGQCLRPTGALLSRQLRSRSRSMATGGSR